MTFLELKPLTAEQLPAVVELDKLCFGGLWTSEGYQQELSSPNSDILVLDSVVIGETEINTKSPIPNSQCLVGLSCFWSILEEAHITLLAVHPDYRRQGLGELLLAGMLRLACRRGLERATLEVKASNQAARSLYYKFGFQEAGRRRRYYKDTGEDALILWRGGLQTAEFEQQLVMWHESVCDRLTKVGWKLLEIGINK